MYILLFESLTQKDLIGQVLLQGSIMHLQILDLVGFLAVQVFGELRHRDPFIEWLEALDLLKILLLTGKFQSRTAGRIPH